MLKNKEIYTKIVDILSTMKATILEILEVEDFKYEIIKDMHISELIRINEKESLLLSQMEHLESQRQDCIETLSLQLGFDPSLSITDIVKKFPDIFPETILNLCSEIKSTCSRLNILTERNQYILKNNSDMLFHILELTKISQNDQYNSQGTAREVSMSDLHVLDQLV